MQGVKVQARIETFAGFQWNCEVDLNDTLVFCASINSETREASGKVETDPNLDFVTALLMELSECGVVLSATVNDIPLSEEWLNEKLPK